MHPRLGKSPCYSGMESLGGYGYIMIYSYGWISREKITTFSWFHPYVFSFHPENVWKMIPILTHMFQMVWFNHPPLIDCLWICFHPSILRGSRRPTQMGFNQPTTLQELFRIPYEAAESDAIRSLEDLEDGDPPNMGVS